MAQIPAALQEPETGTPRRAPRSARRTSHIDMDLLDDGGLVLTGAARDVVTDATGDARVAAQATIRAEVAPSRTLTSLTTDPPVDASALLGAVVGAGFRAAVDAAVPDEHAARTPLYLLLDDLPVAALISGYARLYTGQQVLRGDSEAGRALNHEICSGWRSDGLMMQSIRDGGMPTTIGPPAPVLEPADDAYAWHAMPQLAVGSMRRRRLVDVTPGDPVSVFAMFRDTHVGPDAVERVLHEYSIELDVDPSTMTIVRSEATPRALPWPECPAAADSARRLETLGVDAVRTTVRKEFRGTTTCTHLNDLLRSLGDVSALAALAG